VLQTGVLLRLKVIPIELVQKPFGGRAFDADTNKTDEEYIP
jgi:hypothetical protein